MDGKMDRQVDRWGGRERLQGNEDGEQGQSRDCKGHRKSTDAPSGRRLSFYDNRGRESLWPEGLVN